MNNFITAVLISIVVMFSTVPANLSQPYSPPAVLSVPVEKPIVKKSRVKSVKKLAKSSDLECLAQNIYHESRGEPEMGMIAVGLVTINRRNDSKFPSTICGVVYQSYKYPSGDMVCQFSWVCDSRTIKAASDSWKTSMNIARMLLNGGYIDHAYLVSGAKYFHASSISPGWVRKFTRVTKIGNHVFYR